MPLTIKVIGHVQEHGARIREQSGSRPQEALLVLESRLLFRNRRNLRVRQVQAKVAEKLLARDQAPPVAVIAVVIARNAEEAVVALSMIRLALLKNQRYSMRLDREVNLMLAKESPVL